MKRKLHTLSLAGCTALKACPDETGHRQQASPSWSSDIHNCLSCLCRGRTVRRGVPAPECTFCWKSLLKAFCTSAKGLLYIR